MINKRFTALYIYGLCVIAALLILIARGDKPINSFLAFEAIGFGLSMSLIPIAFVYLKSPRAGYVAAGIISTLFLAQAISTELAGVLTVLGIVAGCIYFVVSRMQKNRAKQKPESFSSE